MKNKDNLIIDDSYLLERNYQKKECKKCKRILPATEEFFYSHPSGNLRHICKTCYKTLLSRKAVAFRHNLKLRQQYFYPTFEIPEQTKTIKLIKKIIEQNKQKNKGILTCEYCHKELTNSNYSIDHKIPLHRGGHPTHINNLAICCIYCQRKKNHLTDSEYIEFLFSENKPIKKVSRKKISCKNIRKSILFILRKELETSDLKLCRTCLRLLPRTQEYFGIHRRNKDGLRNECKKCKQEYDRNYIHKKKKELQLKHNNSLLSFIISEGRK